MNEFGFCKCGCGQRTSLSPITDAAKGWVKGAPRFFIRGHSLRVPANRKQFEPEGTRRISTHGYVEIALGDGRWQYEHILMAENIIGRKLKFFGVGHPDNEVVHHVDGVKTNNVQSNFLFCTHSYHTELHARLEASDAWPEFSRRVNHPNGCKRVGKSGFKGVYLKKSGKWGAVIEIDGRKKKLGAYPRPEQAAEAYDSAVIAAFGAQWATNKSMGLL